VISWLFSAVLATAAPVDAIDVATVQCGGLAADEIARLFALELDDVVPEMRTGPPLRIELTCATPILSIAIVDPLTDKRMSRDVPLPPDEPGRERVIALAIAQLFAASWLELLLPTPPPEQIVTTEPRPPVAAVEAAREKAATTTRRPERSFSLLAAGVVRGRALERAPLVAGGGELDFRTWFGGGALVVRLGFEGTSVRRELGTVRAWMLALGIGVAGRLRLGERWALGVAAVVSGALGRLRGVATRPDVPTGGITAPTGQLCVGLGPRVRLGTSALLELDAELGATLRAPEGLVTGAAPVSLGGLWAGAALRVGFEWTRRAPR
jgi:hypothetical protein